MIEFYLKLVKHWMDGGMSKENALDKVPLKWREFVRNTMESEG